MRGILRRFNIPDPAYSSAQTPASAGAFGCLSGGGAGGGGRGWSQGQVSWLIVGVPGEGQTGAGHICWSQWESL